MLALSESVSKLRAKSRKMNDRVQFLTVIPDDDGQRLDNFLLRHSAGVPRSHVYKIIRSGEVRVNKGRARAFTRLKSGDIVRIPPLTRAESIVSRAPDQALETIESCVVFEDGRMIVLAKPAGWAVHAGSGVGFGVIEALRQSRGADAGRLELVHRLDKQTSGCLIIGKGRQSVLKMQDLFRHRQVRKTYRVLAAGHWQGPARQRVSVDQPLRRNQLEGGERVVQIDPAGKPAVSHFELIENFPQAAELRVEIETGRTHQIRVHAAHLGHFVIGDQKYGDRAALRQYNNAGLRRMYLHCTTLAAAGPDGFDLAVPVDDEWQSATDTLRTLDFTLDFTGKHYR